MKNYSSLLLLILAVSPLRLPGQLPSLPRTAVALADLPRAAVFDPSLGVLRCTNSELETGNEFICWFRLTRIDPIAAPVLFVGTQQFDDGKNPQVTKTFVAGDICSRGYCANGIEQNFEAIVLRRRITDIDPAGAYWISIGVFSASGLLWQGYVRFRVNAQIVGVDDSLRLESVSRIGSDAQGQHMIEITGVFPPEPFRIWIGTGNQFGPAPFTVRSNNGRTAIFSFPHFAEGQSMDIVAIFDSSLIHSTLQKAVLLPTP